MKPGEEEGGLLDCQRCLMMIACLFRAVSSERLDSCAWFRVLGFGNFSGMVSERLGYGQSYSWEGAYRACILYSESIPTRACLWKRLPVQ